MSRHDVDSLGPPTRVHVTHYRLGYWPRLRLRLSCCPCSWNINWALIICQGSVPSMFMFCVPQQGQWSDPRQPWVIPSNPLTLIHPPPHTPYTHGFIFPPAKSFLSAFPSLVICFPPPCFMTFIICSLFQSGILCPGHSLSPHLFYLFIYPLSWMHLHSSQVALTWFILSYRVF